VSVSPSLRIGYLVSRYPAISHTFILREVLALRELGMAIETASINVPDRSPEQLTAQEHLEAERTFYVKRTGPLAAAFSLSRRMVCAPLRFSRAVLFAARLAGTDLRQLLYCGFYLVEAAVLADWMRSRAITHLHVHFATPAATVALLLHRLAPVTFSLTVHGPDEFYDVPGYYLSEKIAEAAFVCAIGLYARSQLLKLVSPESWHKVEVTPLGVDGTLFLPRSTRRSGQPFEILCVGRLVPAKGQHILLDAASQLRDDQRPFLLRLVGDGPDRASLQQQVQKLGLSKFVRFEGAVNQDKIRVFYESADVFALASFAEGIPVVLMEAMSMEIPCIATWITGIPELIRNEIDGLLVGPSDAEGLAKALTYLMDDEVLRVSLGRAGRRRVLDRYHFGKNIDTLAAVFERRLGACA
jgi:colanic acid/amylovoran biosynthesis glycosyltransferase